MASKDLKSSTKWKNPPSVNEKDLKRKKSQSEDWYIAGGSSGGSAVAVATGSCFA